MDLLQQHTPEDVETALDFYFLATGICLVIAPLFGGGRGRSVASQPVAQSVNVPGLEEVKVYSGGCVTVSRCWTVGSGRDVGIEVSRKVKKTWRMKTGVVRSGLRG
jgi:hypothetical protein